MKPILSFLLSLALLGTSCSVRAADNHPDPYEALLNSYMAVKDALADDNSTLAATEAAQFETLAQSPALSGKTQAAFLKEQKKLLEAAHRTAAAKDIEKMRESFREFSDAMIRFVQAAPPGKRIVYVQYCPMKKASWLSYESAIRNPYYGKQMSGCGSVQQTIQPL